MSIGNSGQPDSWQERGLTGLPVASGAVGNGVIATEAVPGSNAYNRMCSVWSARRGPGNQA